MQLQVKDTEIEVVKIVQPERFEDKRGFFSEVARIDQLKAAGIDTEFVQLNHSGSVKNVLRGLHFQWEPPMGKLMRVPRGAAWLVAVDIRHGSPTLGRWVGIEASEENRLQLWAPASFARGYAVLSDYVEIEYLCSSVYNGENESNIRWNDPEIGIEWPLDDPIVSDRDNNAQTFREWLKKNTSKVFTW